MKAEILKIAGVKNEKQFYSKYPTEEAFMKAHKKEFKKAAMGTKMVNAQLQQLTDFGNPPIAQKGTKCKSGYGCHGNSSTQSGEGINKVGSRLGLDTEGGTENYVPLSNAPATWEELQTYNETNPKDKAFKNQLKTLQGQFPELTQQQMLAAGADSARIRQRMGNLSRYDKPEEQTYDKAYHNFYRPLMDQSKPVTIPQILQFQSQQPGGLSGYESTVRGNYNRPKAQTGVQLDMWGNPIQQNITQMPTNPNAGTGQMGLNNAPGGIMNLTPNAAATNATNQAQMFGTGADIKQGGALGGITPSSIKGVGSEMLGKASGALGKLGGVAGIASTASNIIGGIQGLKEEKKQLKQSEQDKALSNLTLQATSMRPERIKNKYVRPEDSMVQPEQLFPSYGVGTNVLTAKDGMQVGGNLGEIQNTYAPNNLYDDLGYEPLSDSEIVKQYRAGGFMPRAQSGFQQLSDYSSAGGADQSGQLFGAAGSAIGGSGFKQNAGSQLGGGIGKAAGSLIGGPVGGLIGSALGSLTGGLLDQKGKKIAANQKATQKNVETGAFQSGAQALQSQNSAFVRDGGLVPYEEGGWVSHDWQPQVITTFGEHKMSDLLKPDPMMNTLRAGGHISQDYVEPSQRALDTMALGGELKTTWGGHAESMSQNPYMPGTGETVMFRGKSHDEGDGNGHTGIGVKYGDGGKMTDYAEFGSENADADVEVERGEPATEMTDGQGQKNMVVFGNLQIPNQLLNHIGDPNAKGKKFKNYIADLAKKEAKQNKIIDKSTNSINELNVYTPFDKLNLDAHQANIIGANMNLKQYADYKMNAAAVQNAINDTATEHGLDADHLAKGKHIKDKEAMKQQAKFGKEIFKAQTGVTYPVYDADGNITSYVDESGAPIAAPATTPVAAASTAASTVPSTIDPAKYAEVKKLYEEAKTAGKKSKKTAEFQKKFHEYFPDFAKEVILSSPEGVTSKGKGKYKTIEDLKKAPIQDVLSTNVDEYFGPRTEKYMATLEKSMKTPPVAPPLKTSTTTPTTTLPPLDMVEPLKRNKWIDAANQLLPYARPSDLDYRVDLNPEMTALSMNQLEPVQAQLYHPQLLTPYDVSYQDQLNEVTAQSREAERMAGQNPAAAAAIMAQANRSKSQILGERFRQNQGQRMGVYNQNIASLNDAQLKNLGILDTQYGRQAEAKSKTKQQAIEVAKSMADKIDKNKLENKTLAVYENTYNYRYSPSGRIQNYNPLQQFDVALGGSGTGKTSGGIAPGYEFTYDASGNIIGTKKQAKDETGKNGVKIKSRNGSIVKAIKGL